MFSNKYESENRLQKLWDGLEGHCLCTMRESCSWCDYGSISARQETRRIVKELAKLHGYQLWNKAGFFYGEGERKATRVIMED